MFHSEKRKLDTLMPYDTYPCRISSIYIRRRNRHPSIKYIKSVVSMLATRARGLGTSYREVSVDAFHGCRTAAEQS